MLSLNEGNEIEMFVQRLFLSQLTTFSATVIRCGVSRSILCSFGWIKSEIKQSPIRFYPLKFLQDFWCFEGKPWLLLSKTWRTCWLFDIFNGFSFVLVLKLSFIILSNAQIKIKCQQEIKSPLVKSVKSQTTWFERRVEYFHRTLLFRCIFYMKFEQFLSSKACKRLQSIRRAQFEQKL